MGKNKTLSKEVLVLSTFTILIPTFLTVTNIILKSFSVTKNAFLSIIYFSYLMHVFLYLCGTPVLQCFFSVSVQILIHKIIKNFPILDFHSLPIKIAGIAFITNSILMLLSFMNSRASVLKMVSVYLITGITPFILFTYYWRSS